MPTLRFGEVAFSYDPSTGWCESVWPDGARLPGFPEDTEAYRATARELGYADDVHRMCIEHEAGHGFTAQVLGLPHSPTLYAVAHGLPEEPSHLDEEYTVCSFQKALNGVPYGNGLDKLTAAGLDIPELCCRFRLLFRVKS